LKDYVYASPYNYGSRTGPMTDNPNTSLYNNWDNNTCYEAYGDINAFYQVNLPSKKFISGIELHNRSDCC
jgi:hypothetical protein